MTSLALAARWAHLAAGLSLVGGAAILLLAGRSDRPTARTWFRAILNWSRALAVVAIASGGLVLAAQVALLEGRPAAALDVHALTRFALDTQAGRV